MNKEEFIIELTKIGIKLSEKQLEQLEIYCNELIKYNEHTNLTAIKEKKDIYLKHFYDSLTLAITIDFNKINNLLDIGTGAGFPGLVIKIAFPNLKVTLLDSNNKKTKFLEYIVNLLKLDNVQIINDRCEKYIKNRREYYDIVTARAVKNLPVLNELCIPFVKIDGYFLAMKGHSSEEIEESKKGIETLNATLEEIKHIKLPMEESERTILKIKKQGNTNLMYPRSYEKILKKPLKNNLK